MHCGTKDVVIGALYHPPKPSYKTELLLDYIEASLDEVTVKNTEAVVVLAGDLNTLLDEDIVARTSLTSIVNELTHGSSKLDHIYVSNPCYQSVKIVSSVVKSDHKAVVAYDGEQLASINKKKIELTFRKRSPAQHACSVRRPPFWADNRNG